MKVSSYGHAPHRAGAGVFWLFTVVSTFFSIPAHSEPPRSTLQQWQMSLARGPLPGRGCFTAHYPDGKWIQVGCIVGLQRPQLPARGPRSTTVGNGHDYAVDLSKLNLKIGSAHGRFKHVNITGESSENIENRYTLQLNTAPFDHAPACLGHSGCKGWQQFIFEQPSGGDESKVYIQYWLLDYLKFEKSCPDGWGPSEKSCYTNSDTLPVPNQSPSALGDLQLYTTAHHNGLDYVILMTPDKTLYAVSNDDHVLYLADHWQAAEYNVFGDGDRSAAEFEPGTTLEVKLFVNDGILQKLKCKPEGFTGETNNLSLGPKCKGRLAYAHDRHPLVRFSESN